MLGTVNVPEALWHDVRAVVCVTSDKCCVNREEVSGYRETDELGGLDPWVLLWSLERGVDAIFEWYDTHRGGHDLRAVPLVRIEAFGR